MCLISHSFDAVLICLEALSEVILFCGFQRVVVEVEKKQVAIPVGGGFFRWYVRKADQLES